ncbi:putative RNA-directed DNA polymerase [Helianthus annuus]|nr:putative RNA-directed DNA polymerase [Helianthus annuus]
MHSYRHIHINRLPSEVIGNKTPYEILYNKKPDYKHMRVFGCLAYYKSTETLVDKFVERGKPGIFVGYPPGTKGYKIFSVKQNKIIISRDVKFVENIFPFKNVTLEEEEIFIPPKWWDSEPVKQQREPDIELDPTGPLLDPETGPSLQPQNTDETDPTSPTDQHTQTEPTNPTQEQHNPNPMGQVGTTHDQSVNLEGLHEAFETVEPQREKRSRSRPKHLDDYEVRLPPSIDHEQSTSNQESSTVHPLAHFISYDKFTNNHKAFLAAITSNHEPKCFSQAVKDPKWVEAMKKEVQVLEENGTWVLEELPEGKRAIDSKWVYKIKYKPNGEIER